MGSARKTQGSRSEERDTNDILKQKKQSLQKIGVNLKADRARVDENDEKSEESDIAQKFDNSIRKEKIDELSKRLHEEGEKKLKARIEMAQNKEKSELSDCSFKPAVNKLTSKQKHYRESRFVPANPDEVSKQFEMKRQRAQTADAKKASQVAD